MRSIIALAVLVPAVAAAETPTFTGDVAPILFESCVVCHRDGEVAPMALTSYRAVRPWARAIKDKVVSREMPPWHADPAGSLAFKNDRRLSDPATYYSFLIQSVKPRCHFWISTAGSLRRDLSAPRK